MFDEKENASYIISNYTYEVMTESIHNKTLMPLPIGGQD